MGGAALSAQARAGAPWPWGTLLSPFGWLYGALAQLRVAAYRRGWKRSVRPPLPTLSIGNISVGGTGKTPLLFDAVRRLEAHGVRVGVLSRGYGGDEGRMLVERHPQALLAENPDRVAGMAQLLRLGPPEVLLLDDGFQHLRLHRDLDVVLVDATRPFGRCLPAGMWRERPSALERAQLVILSRADLVAPEARRVIWERVERARRGAAGVPRLEGSVAVRELRHLCSGETWPAAALRGMEAFVACGIGNPHAFLRLLHGAGVTVQGNYFARDHHPWPEADLRRFAGHAYVLVTEKDGVKLRGRAPDNAWEVRVDWQFLRGEEHWEAALERLLLPQRAARIEPLWQAHDPHGRAVP